LSEAELVKARQRLAEPIDLTGFEELGTHDPEQLRARVKEVKAQIVLPPLEREIAIRKARLAIE
jgi:hypothetical protein